MLSVDFAGLAVGTEFQIENFRFQIEARTNLLTAIRDRPDVADGRTILRFAIKHAGRLRSGRRTRPKRRQAAVRLRYGEPHFDWAVLEPQARTRTRLITSKPVRPGREPGTLLILGGISALLRT